LEQAKTVLYVVLGVVGVWFVFVWGRDLVATRRTTPALSVLPSWWQLFVGFATNFFDWFGIGSFATTTSLYRARRTVDDRVIPGTLNVGHTLPTLAEAFISITIFKVDPTTLVSMIVAAVAGAWLGAGIVARWPRRRVQIGMGVALLVVASIMAYRQYHDPKEGVGTYGVSGGLLVAAVAGNFVLGALMTLGIGLFAPCLLLVAMLGMDVGAGYPIMMGSCAFLMPFASWRFMKERSYEPRAALGLTLGGVPAVLLAAFVVKKLAEKDNIKWIVCVVVLYTAISMLLAARARGRDSGAQRAT
jgi:uncharacterized membrane protein YfcA